MVTRRAPSAARSFLPISRPLCSTFVHVRRGPGSRPNHGPRSVRGQREHACPHRSRPQRPAQTDRLRQATRHRDSAACRRPRLCLLARPFATADLAVILARITSGLLRAAALEAGLCRRAARGRDLTPTSLRPTALYRPRPPRQVAPPDSSPADAAEDRRLARLPTEEAIAAEVRRRPVGAVIVDICRDLGIRPGDCDRAFWDELCHAIIAYGGSLAGFLNGPNRWLTAHGSDDQADPTWPPAPPRPPPLATGPPSRT